ncbi:MAG: hypothetical protein WAL91_00955 [Propionicimonas sp.]
MTAKPNRTHRHSPWFALAAAFALVLGLLVPAADVTAAGYAYKAPIELAAVNSTKSGIELTWRTVTGAPAYRLRAVGNGQTLYQATGSDGTAVFKGLASATSYTFNVAVWQPIDNKMLSAWSTSKATRSTTDASLLDPPTELKVTKQAPTTMAMAWTVPAGFDATAHQVRVDYAEDQAMKTGAGSQFFDGGSGTLTGLSTNTNLFLRASVVARDTHAAAGDRSTAILGKTLSPVGWIHGKVTGAPKAALADYVVAAYSASSGDVNRQVPLTKTDTDGVFEYKVQVRPGDYYLQVSNIGTANYTSLWAQTGADGALVRDSATPIGVSVSNTTEAPPVKVGKGATIQGQITCPGQSTKDSCSVDVTALIGKNVIAEDRSDVNGNYALQGLPASAYTVRMNHAEDRFIAQQASVTVASAGDTVTLDRTLAKRNFLTTYAVRISGTKSVGKVVKFSSRAYLAAVLPTERADDNDFQWFRNGSAISGARGSSYRLTSADRGKRIRLGVRFGRFGFYTSDWAYSASYLVR